MVGLVLILLLVLWLLGYIRIPGFTISDYTLFVFMGHNITLLNLLTFGVILWLISMLPRPFQIAAGIILILWVLSILGIIAINGLSNIIILLIILGVIAFFFKK